VNFFCWSIYYLFIYFQRLLHITWKLVQNLKWSLWFWIKTWLRITLKWHCLSCRRVVWLIAFFKTCNRPQWSVVFWHIKINLDRIYFFTAALFLFLWSFAIVNFTGDDNFALIILLTWKFCNFLCSWFCLINPSSVFIKNLSKQVG